MHTTTGLHSPLTVHTHPSLGRDRVNGRAGDRAERVVLVAFSKKTHVPFLAKEKTVCLPDQAPHTLISHSVPGGDMYCVTGDPLGMVEPSVAEFHGLISPLGVSH